MSPLLRTCVLWRKRFDRDHMRCSSKEFISSPWNNFARYPSSSNVFMTTDGDRHEAPFVATATPTHSKQLVPLHDGFGSVHRLNELPLEPMSDSEIRKIAVSGGRLLNVSFPKPVKDDIVQYSSGCPALCHDLLLTLCQYLGIDKKADTMREVKPLEFLGAVAYLIDARGARMKEAFESVVHMGSDKVFAPAKLVLCALANADGAGLTLSQFQSTMRRYSPRCPTTNCRSILKTLQQTRPIRVVELDPETRAYTYADPLLKLYAMCLFRPLVEERAFDALDENASPLFQSSLHQLIDRPELFPSVRNDWLVENEGWNPPVDL